MLCERFNQAAPFSRIFRRRWERLVPEGVRCQIRGELARHEAKLDKRLHSIFKKSIVDLIYIREVIDRPALRILIVDPHLVMEDGMKADISEVRNLLHSPQVRPIAITEAKHSAAGTKHLLPKVGKGMGGRIRIDRDRFI